ncbi:MAG TPA: NADH-quinone oxidoreductase subunit L [Anaerolineae bacterium]|nr:NADH-quinone oxidoreductase subunit L [Anaerolineae bacterium]
MATWLIPLTIGLPWLGALCVWLIGDQRARAQHTLAVLFSVAAGVAALALLPSATETIALRIPIGGVFGDLTFVPDGLGVFLAAVATVVGSLAVIFSVDYMRGEAQLGRYYALVLLFIGAMAGLVLSGSLLFLFIFWEITAFCSYALIAFHNDDPKAVAGGIKALIITQFGGIGLLVGVLIAYAQLGSYDIANFLANAHALPLGALTWIGFGFLLGAAAKSAQVPLHTWLPDAMEAPTPVSALIHAATMVNAGVYLLARFFPAFEAVPGWTLAVMIIGLLSALLAACMALVANDLKRALAYSTISQLGYMVYAVGVGGVFASQFHLLSHAVFKALLFLGAGAVIHAVGTRDMREMGGLGRVMPFTRTVFVIGALALAGIPILNGFWSKELVLEAGLADGPGWAYAGMLLGAGLTALYTFRMVWLVFFGARRGTQHVHDAGVAMRAALGLLAIGALTTWLLVGPFGELLATTLPFHELHVLRTPEVLSEVVTAPATWVALLVIGVGLAAWQWRDRLAGLTERSRRLAQFAADGLGFEWLNRRIVDATKSIATALRATQTGQLNWNIAGIVGGLLVVLALLAWSA